MKSSLPKSFMLKIYLWILSFVLLGILIFFVGNYHYQILHVIFLENKSHEKFGLSNMTLGVFFFLVIFLSGILYWFFKKQFVEPVLELLDTATNIAKGELDENTQVQRKGMLGLLAQELSKIGEVIEQKNIDLQTINTAGAVFAEIKEQNIALETSMEVMKTRTNVNRGSIYLLNSEGVLELYIASPKIPSSVSPKSFRVGEGVAGETALKKDIFYVPNTKDYPGFIQDPKKPCQRTLLCVPMLDQQEIYGVMNFSGEVGQVRFNSNDKEFALAIGRLTVVTLKYIKVLTQVEEQNESLEEAVRERTGAISELLDNTGQGFLTFGEDYFVHKEYSQACMVFFGEDITGKSILKLLFYDEVESEFDATRELFDMIFEGSSELFLVTPMLPEEIVINERVLAIEYNFIESEQETGQAKMMLILTDITAEKERERQVQEDFERNNMIIKISLDREGFLEFLRELEKLFESLRTALQLEVSQININELFRYYHTIKGGAGIYALKKIVDQSHKVEDLLSPYRGESKEELTREYVEFLKSESYKLEEILNTTLEELEVIIPEEVRNQKERAFRISKSKLLACQKAFISYFGEKHEESIQHLIHDLKKQPIGPILRKFSSMIENLADNLRKEVEVEVIGTETEISLENLSEFFSVVVHLFRNSIDHGIEFADIRKTLGKPPKGKIIISTKSNGDGLEFTIADDGKGIDIEQVKDRAISRGLISSKEGKELPEEELVQLIFLPGFSTQEVVSKYSGRGVGMDAVKETVVKMGGGIQIYTKKNEGTTFQIKLPAKFV